MHKQYLCNIVQDKQEQESSLEGKTKLLLSVSEAVASNEQLEQYDCVRRNLYRSVEAMKDHSTLKRPCTAHCRPLSHQAKVKLQILKKKRKKKKEIHFIPRPLFQKQTDLYNLI